MNITQEGEEQKVRVTLISGKILEVSLEVYNFLLENKELLKYNSYEDLEKMNRV